MVSLASRCSTVPFPAPPANNDTFRTAADHTVS